MTLSHCSNFSVQIAVYIKLPVIIMEHSTEPMLKQDENKIILF